jgi:hypothetical protein
MTQTHFGFKTVSEEDKARRVRGVFDSVASQIRHHERLDVYGFAPRMESLCGDGGQCQSW